MLASQQPGTTVSPGGYIAEAAENIRDLILVVNDDNDDGAGRAHRLCGWSLISAADDEYHSPDIRLPAGFQPQTSGL